MDQLIFSKTRIAPTPSGFLHLGNVLSFAVTAALARKTHAKILLRIDDLDRERLRKEYVQDIFDTLNYLEIPWDEGPADYGEYEREYSQIHRMEHYQTALRELRESGKLFACDCSRKDIAAASQKYRMQSAQRAAPLPYPGTCRKKKLPLDRAEMSWRLFTNEPKGLTVKILGRPATHTRLPASMKDFIVRKKDGFPAYQLASAADDEHFGIDLVVRGSDLWNSTLAQLYLSGCFGKSGFRQNTFFHHPLLTETGGRKLSKSAGDISVRSFRKAGKKPAAVFARIASLSGFAGHAGVRDFQTLAQLVISRFPELRRFF